ncbi:MAG: hypothetical protein VX249_12770, partial [Pseudomonadota bacterium]|nr:hypothetical protein [Pseudomonadota bacterium]
KCRSDPVVLILRVVEVSRNGCHTHLLHREIVMGIFPRLVFLEMALRTLKSKRKYVRYPADAT